MEASVTQRITQPIAQEVEAAIMDGGASVREEQKQYLTFMLGEEVFAIGIAAIKEIIEYGEVTSVPMMPGFVRGVINLRGAVVPVIDLSARFGKAETALSRRTCIVIVEVDANFDRQVIGVMVDAVSEVLEIAGKQIEPAPALGMNLRTELIKGMGKVDGGFAIIIDIDRLLAGEAIGAAAVPA